MPNHASLYYNTSVNQVLVPIVRTATVLSSSVDLQNCDDAFIVVNLGATGDTLSGTNKTEYEVQESDDNTTFTAVADADLTKVVTGATATGTFASIQANASVNTAYFTGYRGSKRYIKVNERHSGTQSTGTASAVSVFLGRNRQSPVNA